MDCKSELLNDCVKYKCTVPISHVHMYQITYLHCRYISEVLPLSDWSNELVKTSLCLLVKRIERLMGKVQKKRLLRVNARRLYLV
jgi:hypothetical protein